MDPSILILVLFIAIMYMLLIRPQQKRQAEHRRLLASLEEGDDVVTAGGLHGRVAAVYEDAIDLEVTDDVVLRFQRSSIARKIEYGEEGETETGKEAAER